MVRHPWVPDGTEQDTIKATSLQHRQPILRHHASLAQVALAAPVELLGVQVEVALQLGEGRERLDALGDDLMPNAIARQHSDLIVAHRSSFSFTCCVLCQQNTLFRTIHGRFDERATCENDTKHREFPISYLTSFLFTGQGVSSTRCPPDLLDL